MKKVLIFGVLLSAFLVVATPTITAQQYVLVKNSSQNELETEISQLSSLLKGSKNQNNLKKIGISDEVDDFISTLEGNYSTNSFLSNLIISLLLAFFGTLFGATFGPLIVLFIKIITLPAVMLANVISSFF